MLSNFLKTTIRNLLHEKINTVINIAGLALAIASCLILGLYLRSDLTYDRHHIKHRQIYRLVNEIGISGNLFKTADTSQLLGPMLTREYADVKGYVRFKIIKGAKAIIRHEDKTLSWDNVYFADDNVFDIFTHDIIYGDPRTALIDPTSAAVSESFAKKYFGDANPIGEKISFKQQPYKITLVFADLPENTHLKYDVLFSYIDEKMADLDDVEANLQARIGSLFDGGDYTYLLMSQDYELRNFKNISDSFYKHHVAGFLNETGFSWRCWIQRLADIHLNSDIESSEPTPTGNKHYLYGFATVGIFILLVACINYMNLATASAARRAKEVGIKKVLGSGRINLLIQFLGEAIILSLIALVFAIILVRLSLILTPITELMDKPLTLNLWNDPGLLVWILLFSLVLGLMAGIYPALYLSSLLPLSALVSGYQMSKGSIRLRKILVLIQLMISIFSIACALFMVKQMQYVSNKSVGFKKENRLIITLRGADLVDKVPILKKEISKISGILGVSLCSGLIGKSYTGNGAMVDNNDDIPEMTMFFSLEADSDFIEVMGLELTEGRGFTDKAHADTKISYLVNETMVKKMGWRQPLGKRIHSGVIPERVIGVIKDFHYASLYKQVGPFALKLFSGTEGIPVEERQNLVHYLVLNISGENISHTLKYLEKIFAEFNPEHPFEFEFLNDILDKMYLSEQHLTQLIGIFSSLCIFISCLGLFGLTALTTAQRSKEIGIRKVLGASTWQILALLVRNIMLLILGGAIVASLIAYYVMDEWLSDFAYRIDINKELWVFILSVSIVAVVAFITIVLQSFKTARSNPVNAMRYE